MFWRKKSKISSSDYHVDVTVAEDGPGGINIVYKKVDAATLNRLMEADRTKKKVILPSSYPSTDELQRQIALSMSSPFIPTTEPQIITKVREALAVSITAGEDTKHLQSRLAEFIDNPDTIKTIAYNEPGYIVSAAILEFGQLSGAIGKEWQSPRCCETCDKLDGKRVAIDEAFSNNDRLGHPPLHADCYCGIRLIYDNEHL